MKQRQKSKKILQSLKNLITGTPIESSISDLDRRAELLLRKLERGRLTNKNFNSLDKELKELLVKKVMKINEQKLKQNSKGNEKANKKLLKSAKGGSIVGILYSLLKGADINIEDKNGQSILHFAGLRDHLNIIKFLAENKYLREKIDWNVKDYVGDTFVHNAAYNGHLNIIKFLAENKYLRDKIDWNAKDNYGWTILHSAVSEDRLNIIKFLAENKYLREKIDWNAKDNGGNTFLHTTVYNNHQDIIEFFLSNNKNFELIKDSIYALNRDGHSVLGIATGEIEAYLISIRYNPFIGKMEKLEDYKKTYKEILKKLKTIENAKGIAKEKNFNENVFILGISLYFSENCDNKLLKFIS